MGHTLLGNGPTSLERGGSEITAPVEGGPPIAQADGVSLAWMVAVLLRERRRILRYATVGLLLGIVVALVRKPTYTSSFSFLPQSGQDPSKAAGLASLAGQFGISLGALGGSQQPPQLYADLLTTREVLTPIVRDSFIVDSGKLSHPRLPEFLRVRGTTDAVVLDKTLRVLRREVISSVVAVRTTGMVTVSVKTESPQVSQNIAERLLAGLNRFNLVTRQSQAAEERRFTEARYESAKQALRQQEDRLEQFMRNNRQYSNSPQLTFERDRIQAEVSLRQQVVQTLAQQYEDARIKEVRDTPVITVIDKPSLPARPDPQLRAWILLVSTVTAGALGWFLSMFQASRSGNASAGDPDHQLLMREWRRLRGAKPNEAS